MSYIKTYSLTYFHENRYFFYPSNLIRLESVPLTLKVTLITTLVVLFIRLGLQITSFLLSENLCFRLLYHETQRLQHTGKVVNRVSVYRTQDGPSFLRPLNIRMTLMTRVNEGSKGREDIGRDKEEEWRATVK